MWQPCNVHCAVPCSSRHSSQPLVSQPDNMKDHIDRDRQVLLQCLYTEGIHKHFTVSENIKLHYWVMYKMRGYVVTEGWPVQLPVMAASVLTRAAKRSSRPGLRDVGLADRRGHLYLLLLSPLLPGLLVLGDGVGVAAAVGQGVGDHFHLRLGQVDPDGLL